MSKIGGNWPHPAGRPCPAKSKTCHACSEQNHFSKMCRSKRYNSVPPAPQGAINFTETELQDQDSSSSEEYVYVITDQVNAVTSN